MWSCKKALFLGAKLMFIYILIDIYGHEISYDNGNLAKKKLN